MQELDQQINKLTGQNSLDEQIDTIFNKIPHERLLSFDARRFFRVKIDIIKRRRLRGKKRWIREATTILDKFHSELNGQSRRFISFFAPD